MQIGLSVLRMGKFLNEGVLRMNDILFGNNNRPIIKKLARRYFKASKSRNIIAIVAIVLTTVLFTTIFTLGSGLIDTVQDQNIRKAGGDGQAVLNYISDEVFNDVKGNALIDRVAYSKAVSYRLNNPGLAKWRSDMWYMDDTALEFALSLIHISRRTRQWKIVWNTI